MRVLVVFAHPKRETFRNLIEVGTLSYCGVTESDTHIVFEVYWDDEATASYIPKAREIGRTAFGPAVS